MPLMSPLAIDGAAPMTTTKMIALSLSLNSKSAAGNHATEGMVCSPVIIDPIAARSTLLRATSAPIVAPMTERECVAVDRARTACSGSRSEMTLQLSKIERTASSGDGSA